ncbi:hypothetical protein E2C01_016660 [Portunus trituberculatus]|uniref:Secreted protein n=1 Tax=Portunus trituberculatus TaxID=210409 RepID=A0A5B7DRJ5_PORTR|nr:hypothetical protein [Portunus trituberculatus]
MKEGRVAIALVCLLCRFTSAYSGCPPKLMLKMTTKVTHQRSCGLDYNSFMRLCSNLVWTNLLPAPS